MVLHLPTPLKLVPMEIVIVYDCVTARIWSEYAYEIYGLLLLALTFLLLMPHTGHLTQRGLAASLSVHLQLLSRLLKSSHPEDLQAANRLIKSLVKEVGIFPLDSAEPALDRSCTVCVRTCDGVDASPGHWGEGGLLV